MKARFRKIGAEPDGGMDHRNPMVIRDVSGERPVRTAEDWAARRKSIIEGMQAAIKIHTSLWAEDLRFRARRMHPAAAMKRPGSRS